MSRLFFVALTAVVALTACNKERDSVDVSELTGKWSLTNDDPRLSIDGTATYTFDADGDFKLVTYDILADIETTFEGTYQVSLNDSAIITLTYDDEIIPATQFFVKKLNASEMKWQLAVYGYEPPVQRWVRVNDRSQPLI